MKKSNLWIERYDETKFFGLYNGNDLVGIFVYKTGARHIKELIEQLENRIEELEEGKMK